MNNKKILLMYPNFKWAKWMERTLWKIHPYNLGILSATLEDKFDVEIFDANLDDSTEEDFSKKIVKTNPCILEISVLTNEYGEPGFTAVRIAKEVDPNIKVIMVVVS